MGGKLYLPNPDGLAFLVVLFCPDVGLAATIDGLGLTAIRTAAAVALAARQCETARSPTIWRQPARMRPAPRRSPSSTPEPSPAQESCCEPTECDHRHGASVQVLVRILVQVALV